MSDRLQRVRCAVCDKETAARLPQGGDGSTLFPRRHRPGWASASTRPDGTCQGDGWPAQLIETSTLAGWAAAIERPADRGGDALTSALRTLRDVTTSKPAPSIGERLRAWRDELRAGPVVGHFIAAEIERRFPEAFE